MVDCQFLAFIKNPVKNVHQTATFSTNWPDVFEYCAPLDCRYCKNKWKVSVVFLAKIRYQTILYSAEATILDKINGKFTPLPPPLISPQNQGWKMGSFGFCPASSLIWGGGGGLLFHFILSKTSFQENCKYYVQSAPDNSNLQGK